MQTECCQLLLWVESDQTGTPSQFQSSQRKKCRRISLHYTLWVAGSYKSFPFLSCWLNTWMCKTNHHQKIPEKHLSLKLIIFFLLRSLEAFNYKAYGHPKIRLTILLQRQLLSDLHCVPRDHIFPRVVKCPWHLINQWMWLSGLCMWDIMSSWLESLREGCHGRQVLQSSCTWQRCNLSVAWKM